MIKKLNRLRQIECNKALVSMEYVLMYADNRNYKDNNLKKVLDKFKDHITKTRICTKCSKEKSLTKEFFTWQNTRNTFRADCKICHKKSVKKYTLKSKDKKIKYRKKNKVRMKEYGKKYRKLNKEKVSKKGKNWYNQNKKRKLKKNKQWSEDNKERHKELRLNWYKQNKHRCLASYHRRKRALNAQTPKWYDHSKVLKIFKKAQDMRLNGKNVSVDHIIPLQAKNITGLHVHNNLKIISHSKNCGKRNRIVVGKPMEYYFGNNWFKKIA